MASFFTVRNAVGALLTMSLAVGCGDNGSVGDVDFVGGPGIGEQGGNENGPGSQPGFFVPNPGPDGLVPGRFISNGGPVLAGPVFGDFGALYGSRVTDGSVIRIAAPEGGSSDILVRLDHLVRELNADGAGVFWLSDRGDAVHGYEWNEQIAETLYNTTGATSLTIDTNQLYFGTEAGEVFQADRGGGAAPVLIASVGGLVNHMTRAGDYLYFTTLSSDGGGLYRAHVAKDSVEPLAAGFNFDSGIVVDDSYVFWGDADRRAVMRLWNTGGEPVSIANNQYQVSALAGERFFLYFASNADHTIKVVPKIGGEVTPLATEESYVGHLQLAGGRLFWTNEGPAGIMYLGL